MSFISGLCWAFIGWYVFSAIKTVIGNSSKKPAVHRYFVSYSHNSGFGSCDITIDPEISSGNIIKKIKESIEKQEGMNEVVILYWRRFEV